MALSFTFKGPKAKADEDAKPRKGRDALDTDMADDERDHGEFRDKRGLLDTLAQDHDEVNAEFVPKGARRHFTSQRSTLSGPGTLGQLGPGIGLNSSSPAAPFMTSSFGKISNSAPLGPAADKSTFDEEDTHTNIIALASNLPPAIDMKRVEDLFSEHPRLKVTRIVPHPSKPSASGARPSTQFKIYFERGTTANDLTHFTNAYNDTKYMGKGYYLHIDRFRNDSELSKKAEPAPFGATETKRDTGVAPPTEFGARGGGRGGGGGGGGGGWGRGRGEVRGEGRYIPEDKEMVVPVQVPKDVAMLRLIHMTVENVIKGGIEFEAALMEDPQVQEQERFAWLYLHDHPYHRYYRWRLFQLVTSSGGDHVARARLFEDEAEWRGPKKPFEDEFACEFVELSKPEYNDDRHEEDRLVYDNIGVYSNVDSYAAGILTPLQRTLLIHYLSAMPVSEKIKNDDVAFFSMFAVEASAQGRDEVVDLLITNIFHPFALSKTKTGPGPGQVQVQGQGQGQCLPDVAESSKRLATATVNALCILSDVAWVTSKEGGHIAYRRYIEQQLVERKVFEYLQTVPSRFVGKLNTGPFRNGVNEVLEGWKEEVLFDVEKLKHYDSAFNERTRQEEAEMKAKKVMEKREREKQRGNASRPAGNLGSLDGAHDMDAEQSGDDNDNGAVVSSGGEGVEDEPEQKEKAAYDPDTAMAAGDTVDAGEALDQLGPVKGTAQHQTEQRGTPAEMEGESAAARARRLRPKAEDMIALDDD